MRETVCVSLCSYTQFFHCAVQLNSYALTYDQHLAGLIEFLFTMCGGVTAVAFVCVCYRGDWFQCCTTHVALWPSPQVPGCDSGGHTPSVQLPSVPEWPPENYSPGPRDSTGPLFPGESARSAAVEQDALWHHHSAKKARTCICVTLSRPQLCVKFHFRHFISKDCWGLNGFYLLKDANNSQTSHGMLCVMLNMSLTSFTSAIVITSLTHLSLHDLTATVWWGHF